MTAERLKAIGAGVFATSLLVAIVAAGASPRARRGAPGTVAEPLAVAVRLAAADPVCCITAEEEARLQALSYREFNQDLNGAGGGWRRYGQSLGCFRAAAELIDRYAAVHAGLGDDDRINLRWHAGQLYGFAGDFTLARTRFVASLNPNEPADWPILWNDYVFGTIAFLDNDLETLRAHRDRIARGPGLDGKKPNLNVLDRLLDRFGEPYATAYGIAAPARECVAGSR